MFDYQYQIFLIAYNSSNLCVACYVDIGSTNIMISLKPHTRISFLVIACSFITFPSACSDQTFTINIPSTFKGHIYIVSSTGTQDKNLIQLDSTGVVYVTDYCKGNLILNISVDGKPLQPQLGYLERHYASGNHNDTSYTVTYTTFLFPLQAKKDYTKEEQSIDELLNAGKVDIMKLKSCE